VSFSEDVVGQDNADALGPALRFGWDPATRRMTVAGELDSANADVLADVMVAVLERDPGDLTIDISELDFVDTPSKTSFLASCVVLGSAATSSSIIGASETTLRACHVLGLDARPSR
jgi:anti-anti-sigma regulatory factor